MDNIKSTEKNENGVVYGKNAVIELLKSKIAVDTLYLSDSRDDKAFSYITALAKEKGSVVKSVNDNKLNKLCASERHQGVAATCCLCEFKTTDDILRFAAERDEKPFVIIADGIEDPHNLGAIIRTAECAGAHGVIIPERNCCGISPAVHKSSAGACSHVLIARVGNLANEIRYLKSKGIFCYCTDGDGVNCFESDISGASAFVIGSEGKGVSRLLRELCDVTLSIPMFGNLNSLNASVAAGIVMYEYVRQQGKGMNNA